MRAIFSNLAFFPPFFFCLNLLTRPLLVEMKEKLIKSSEIPTEKMQEHFDGLRSALESQFAKFTEASSKLSSHDQTKVQQCLEEFEGELQRKSDELIPRKKFGFKSKGNGTATHTVFKPLAARAETETPIVPIPLFFSVFVCKSLIPLLVQPAAIPSTETVKKIENYQNATIVIEKPGPVVITGCSHCTILILAPAATLRVDRSSYCDVYAAPVSGSIYMEHCDHINFQLCCRQARY